MLIAHLQTQVQVLIKRDTATLQTGRVVCQPTPESPQGTNHDSDNERLGDQFHCILN